MKNFLLNIWAGYKQELIATPIILLLFFLLNWLGGVIFPHSAFFDAPSQMETLYYGLLKTVFASLIAWVIYRISFPSIYKFIREELYLNFNLLELNIKVIISVALFIAFLLCASMSLRAEVRSDLIKALNTQLNVRESSPNRGPMVDKYLHSVGVNIPAPWCAAFVSFNLQAFKIANPNSAWSPDYAKKQDVIWTPKQSAIKPQPADVFTLYYTKLRRVGHTGFYIGTDKSGYFITIEGNTNGGGSRDGDGVYKKKREPGKIYAISRFIK
jgi:hypothetical protein